MTCISECKECSVQGNDLEIRNFTNPQPAVAGSIVNISFDVWHCSGGFCGEKYFTACIYRNGQCVKGTDWIHILANQTVHVTIPITMPSEGGPFNGNISIIGGDYGGLQVGCAYSLSFSVQQYIPPGQPKYNCVNKNCDRNDNCTSGCYSDSNCGSGCTGGNGGGVCESTEINLGGGCLPKSIVLIGAVFLFMYMMQMQKRR